jgi:hypothetical protein
VCRSVVESLEAELGRSREEVARLRQQSSPPTHTPHLRNASQLFSLLLFLVLCSVADPDPPDPRVFGPPGFGSGSTSQRYGSGSFYHHAKIVRKTLIPTVLSLLLDILFLKNDVNVPSKSKKEKN